MKFSPDGRLLMTLGKPGKAGPGNDEFNAPSAVYVARNGDIFVADGHGGETNARIVKFDKDGKFIKTWGKKGAGPGEIDGPHTLAMDQRGRLFLGDRTNNRIQIFDQDGTFIAQWHQFSRPSGVFIDKNDTSMAEIRVGIVAPAHGAWKRGIRVGRVSDGAVTAFVPTLDSRPRNERRRRLPRCSGQHLWCRVGPKRVNKYVKN